MGIHSPNSLTLSYVPSFYIRIRNTVVSKAKSLLTFQQKTNNIQVSNGDRDKIKEINIEGSRWIPEKVTREEFS